MVVQQFMLTSYLVRCHREGVVEVWGDFRHWYDEDRHSISEACPVQVTHAELVDVDRQRMVWAVEHDSEVIVFYADEPVSGIYVGILVDSKNEAASILLPCAAS